MWITKIATIFFQGILFCKKKYIARHSNKQKYSKSTFEHHLLIVTQGFGFCFLPVILREHGHLGQSIEEWT